jgi:pSer/pThr/pTyr-binding forkhead associated (FHA) protein
VGLPGYTNVADVHVEVAREKGEYVLTDAGSRTGTFVNDSRVEKTVLHEGDVIRVGNAQFQFRKK